MMKKVKTGFLSAALSVGMLAFTFGSVAQTVDAKVIVVTDPSFVPFESLDQATGKYVGYDMGIIRAISERAVFDYKLETMNFNGIIPALQADSVDIAIAGIGITKKRAKKVGYSDPYYEAGLKILVRSDNDTIKTVDDFKGKSVSTKIGSTSYHYLTKKVVDIDRQDCAVSGHVEYVHGIA